MRDISPKDFGYLSGPGGNIRELAGVSTVSCADLNSLLSDFHRFDVTKVIADCGSIPSALAAG
jgi:hypothetical protein